MNSRLIEFIKTRPELYKRLYPFRRLFISKKKTGYSRMGEDFIIEYLFDSLGKKEISYLDVGANDPYIFNDTYLFYKRKKKGVLVEPDPALCKRLKKARPTDICLNIGVGIRNEVMDLYMFDCDELNTFSQKEAEKIIEGGDYHLRELKRIKVLTIEKIFSQFFGDKAPDYISFDTEGIELDVLKSIDFSKYRPDVISVRTLEYNGGDRKKNMQSVEYLKDQGYSIFADTWLKMIMVRKDILKSLL